MTNSPALPDTEEEPRKPGLALVFPGQGSQYVGMGARLFEESPEAARVLERADDTLGFPLSRLILEGPAEELDMTINAQPAILATSVAYLEAMRDAAEEAGVELTPQRLAGHSAGQYAAAVAANALDFADALRLVRERGRIMQESGEDGGMGAVVGLSEDQVDHVVSEARQRGEISVANENAPGQIVLSGVVPAVVFALELSKSLGARRTVRLAVSVASHSMLMRRAQREFAAILSRVPFREPAVPLLGNVHASVIHSADGLRTELTEHLTHGVQWTAAVRRMVASGITDFVEVGPGRVLSGLIKRIDPVARVRYVDGNPIDPQLWSGADDGARS